MISTIRCAAMRSVRASFHAGILVVLLLGLRVAASGSLQSTNDNIFARRRALATRAAEQQSDRLRRLGFAGEDAVTLMAGMHPHLSPTRRYAGVLEPVGGDSEAVYDFRTTVAATGRTAHLKRTYRAQPGAHILEAWPEGSVSVVRCSLSPVEGGAGTLALAMDDLGRANEWGVGTGLVSVSGLGCPDAEGDDEHQPGFAQRITSLRVSGGVLEVATETMNPDALMAGVTESFETAPGAPEVVMRAHYAGPEYGVLDGSKCDIEPVGTAAMDADAAVTLEDDLAARVYLYATEMNLDALEAATGGQYGVALETRVHGGALEQHSLACAGVGGGSRVYRQMPLGDLREADASMWVNLGREGEEFFFEGVVARAIVSASQFDEAGFYTLTMGSEQHPGLGEVVLYCPRCGELATRTLVRGRRTIYLLGDANSAVGISLDNVHVGVSDVVLRYRLNYDAPTLTRWSSYIEALAEVSGSYEWGWGIKYWARAGGRLQRGPWEVTIGDVGIDARFGFAGYGMGVFIGVKLSLATLFDMSIGGASIQGGTGSDSTQPFTYFVKWDSDNGLGYAREIGSTTTTDREYSDYKYTDRATIDAALTFRPTMRAGLFFNDALKVTSTSWGAAYLEAFIDVVFRAFITLDFNGLPASNTPPRGILTGTPKFTLGDCGVPHHIDVQATITVYPLRFFVFYEFDFPLFSLFGGRRPSSGYYAAFERGTDADGRATMFGPFNVLRACLIPVSARNPPLFFPTTLLKLDVWQKSRSSYSNCLTTTAKDALTARLATIARVDEADIMVTVDTCSRRSELLSTQRGLLQTGVVAQPPAGNKLTATVELLAATDSGARALKNPVVSGLATLTDSQAYQDGSSGLVIGGAPIPTQTRSAICTDGNSNRPVDMASCVAFGLELNAALLERPCKVQPCVTYEWSTDKWSGCVDSGGQLATCDAGSGEPYTQTRAVVCTGSDGSVVSGSAATETSQPCAYSAESVPLEMRNRCVPNGASFTCECASDSAGNPLYTGTRCESVVRPECPAPGKMVVVDGADTCCESGVYTSTLECCPFSDMVEDANGACCFRDAQTAAGRGPALDGCNVCGGRGLARIGGECCEGYADKHGKCCPPINPFTGLAQEVDDCGNCGGNNAECGYDATITFDVPLASRGHPELNSSIETWAAQSTGVGAHRAHLRRRNSGASGGLDVTVSLKGVERDGDRVLTQGQIASDIASAIANGKELRTPGNGRKAPAVAPVQTQAAAQATPSPPNPTASPTIGPPAVVTTSVDVDADALTPTDLDIIAATFFEELSATVPGLQQSDVTARVVGTVRRRLLAVRVEVMVSCAAGEAAAREAASSIETKRASGQLQQAVVAKGLAAPVTISAPTMRMTTGRVSSDDGGTASAGGGSFSIPIVPVAAAAGGGGIAIVAGIVAAVVIRHRRRQSQSSDSSPNRADAGAEEADAGAEEAGEGAEEAGEGAEEADAGAAGQLRSPAESLASRRSSIERYEIGSQDGSGPRASYA
ncbi:unnamed protein product [Pedinophyceae sp. YPF-701]|nr:unnamed protein product [Pedinophyceae sp. YPF-701]